MNRYEASEWIAVVIFLIYILVDIIFSFKTQISCSSRNQGVVQAGMAFSSLTTIMLFVCIVIVFSFMYTVRNNKEIGSGFLAVAEKAIQKKGMLPTTLFIVGVLTFALASLSIILAAATSKNCIRTTEDEEVDADGTMAMLGATFMVFFVLLCVGLYSRDKKRQMSQSNAFSNLFGSRKKGRRNRRR